MAVELVEDLPEKDDPDFEYKEKVVMNATAAAYIGMFSSRISWAFTHSLPRLGGSDTVSGSS